MLLLVNTIANYSWAAIQLSPRVGIDILKRLAYKLEKDAIEDLVVAYVYHQVLATRFLACQLHHSVFVE
jgi:hypothetical protein